MKHRTFNLQLFAAGDNNNQAARSYSKEFKELLQAVFGKQSYFRDFFAGDLEAIDGIQHKDTAFSVKTSDVACVVTKGSLAAGGTPAYDTGAAVAFGAGTGSTSRFGNRTEIIYVDTDVPYTWDWVIHEGIDRHTVNNSMEAAVADRLDLQAQAKIDMFNEKHAAFISAAAGKTINKTADITSANVGDLFNELHKHFVNIGAKGTKVAKVTPDIYGAIIDTGLMVSSKNGTVSEDDQIVEKFKGFVIEEIPEDLFQVSESTSEGTTTTVSDLVYAYVQNVGKAFTGIETARTIESEDFDGVALQGAGKAGEWILPDNKAAVAKVTLTSTSVAG